MDRAMVEISGVTKRFGDTVAVDDAVLQVRRGEMLALLGPSGCGKTTLLRMIAGFERPDSGTIAVDGEIVAGPGSWAPPEKRRVGMVFQDYALFPHLTVGDNVGFGLQRDARRQRVPMLLALVDLCGLGDRYPHELSGGQQQRVALARALAPGPDVILLDEPWSNVDPQLRETLRQEVASVLRPLGVTGILVTHDREEAFTVADRIALVRDGAIVQVGTPEELYYHPATRWAAEFVGAGNVLTGRVEDGLVETPLGRFPARDAACPDGVDATGMQVGGVQVMVRPELLELCPDPAGTAEVVGREFRGHDVAYRVRLDGGVELLSQRPSNELVPLGARVTIRLHDGPVAVLAG